MDYLMSKNEEVFCICLMLLYISFYKLCTHSSLGVKDRNIQLTVSLI